MSETRNAYVLAEECAGAGIPALDHVLAGSFPPSAQRPEARP